MIVDAGTASQIEVVVDAARNALDQIGAMLGDRDLAFNVTPTATFLAFAASSQLLQQQPRDQLAWINSGMEAVGSVLAKRGAEYRSRYGKGRRCAAITVEMARSALESAKKDVEATNLVVNRKAARDTLLYKALLEFCVVSKLLQPADQAAMMSAANEQCASVLRSGWLDRNVIKIT